MVWIAILLLAILEAVHWLYVRDRMRTIEQIHSRTLKEMWDFIHKESDYVGDMEGSNVRGVR